MRALIQRVCRANVLVEERITGAIENGLLVFIGIERTDQFQQAEWLAGKIVRLRVFPDADKKMNLSLLDIKGELLIVSQFTLCADMSRGNRPSYSAAAPPREAKLLYEYFVACCQDKGVRVQTGEFQAHMKVELVNDGPVTLWCQTESSERNTNWGRS